jgi:predicted enzyme related to lactoylglutathione lyase
MNTPFLGLRTCIYRVKDLSSATEWYSQLLGIRPYFDQPFYVGFEVGGYELGLQPEEGEKSSPGENVETYWGVENIDAVFAQMLAGGATAHQEPTDVGSGIKVATAKDPWGNLVGIIYNPHFRGGL